MLYERILLAYDGSKEGRVALRQGAELAQLCQAEVCLLAVVKFPTEATMAVGVVPEQYLQEEEQYYYRTLQEGLERLQARGIAAQGKLVHGEPVEQIATVAKSISADLVVVGHRNRTRLARWWSGSVGISLIDAVDCSVLVARASEDVVGN
jgi:nucleotide-binding universal stress UspA family protein